MRCSGKHDGAADALNREIVDAFSVLIKQAGMVSHALAAEFGVSPSDLLALFKLEDGIAMKELASRLGCDASFVTVIADTLERQGLARREPSVRDRRVKNLVLTAEGNAARERLLRELAVRMPWCSSLSRPERRCFLRLLRKMAGTGNETEQAAVPPGGDAVTEQAGSRS